MPNIFHKNGKNNLHFQMDIFDISIFNIIEKVSSAKAEKIEESNSIYYSKLQWCPLSACLTPIINRKKNLPLVHNHIYVQPHYFINFDLFLIKLDLFTVDIALSCHQQKTTVFTNVFTFFFMPQNLFLFYLLLLLISNLFSTIKLLILIILCFEWNLGNLRSKF